MIRNGRRALLPRRPWCAIVGGMLSPQLTHSRAKKSAEASDDTWNLHTDADLISLRVDRVGSADFTIATSDSAQHLLERRFVAYGCEIFQIAFLEWLNQVKNEKHERKLSRWIVLHWSSEIRSDYSRAHPVPIDPVKPLVCMYAHCQPFRFRDAEWGPMI